MNSLEKVFFPTTSTDNSCGSGTNEVPTSEAFPAPKYSVVLPVFGFTFLTNLLGTDLSFRMNGTFSESSQGDYC